MLKKGQRRETKKVQPLNKSQYMYVKKKKKIQYMERSVKKNPKRIKINRKAQGKGRPSLTNKIQEDRWNVYMAAVVEQRLRTDTTGNVWERFCPAVG